MRLPDNSKFRRWKWLEIAKYDPVKSRVFRMMKNDNAGARVPILVEWGDEIEEFRKQNSNTGIYSSIFHYDSVDLGQATRLSSLYFDLDSPGAALAWEDAKKLVDYLRERIPRHALRVYFSGDKGFHIECEAIALGIGPTNDLPGLFRYIAHNVTEELGVTTHDTSVYEMRRMWRIPNSKHQKTGLFKVDLSDDVFYDSLESIKSYASVDHFDIEVPEQQFNAKANEWYREWTYKKETQRALTIEEKIVRFEKFGTGLIVKDDPDAELVFNPDLFSRCPAILRLWGEAERNQNLSHEARLFLCSILSYTPESEKYLHHILANCDDYNPEKTESHILDWKKRRELGIGGRPYTCERANAAGVGCGQCELEPKEKLERVNGQLVRTGELASPSPIRYAYTKKTVGDSDGN